MPRRATEQPPRHNELHLRNQGFTRLIKDSGSVLGRYVSRLMGRPGAAEDIIQEVYLRTYAQGGDPEPLRPYLFTVARNLAFKARRHERVMARLAPKVTPDDSESLYGSPEEEAIAQERMRLLNEAISSLAPQCRAVFTRRMFHDHSYKEIASQLGISEKTVEKHIAAGVRQIHAALARRYQEGPSA